LEPMEGSQTALILASGVRGANCLQGQSPRVISCTCSNLLVAIAIGHSTIQVSPGCFVPSNNNQEGVTNGKRASTA